MKSIPLYLKILFIFTFACILSCEILLDMAIGRNIDIPKDLFSALAFAAMITLFVFASRYAKKQKKARVRKLIREELEHQGLLDRVNTTKQRPRR